MANLSPDFVNLLRYRAARSIDGSGAGEAPDPYNRSIWRDDLPGEIAQSQYTFVFSGPPLLAEARKDARKLTPVGLLQGMQMGTQRQMTPIPELGNKRIRHVGGRNNHSITLTRVLSRSGNLLGMLYRWLLMSDPQFHVVPNRDQVRMTDDNGREEELSYHVVTPDSDIIDYPFGLYLVVLTADLLPISAEFYEHCMYAGGGKSIDAGQNVVIESLQIVCGKIVPASPTIMPTAQVQAFSIEPGNGVDENIGGAPVLPPPIL